MRILVIRPDRIGDVILSTPVFEAIKLKFPRAHLTVMVQEALVSILKGNPFVDELIVYEPQGRHKGVAGLYRLYAEIRAGKFDTAVVLQTHWKLGFSLVAAGVPSRIGPLSKIHSYLFYNQGKRQKRSKVEMHEAEYNLQLLNQLGIEVPSKTIPTRISISNEVQEKAAQWIKVKGLKKGFILVHPGMGGSALNWPESHYAELIQKLVVEGYPVLVSGGPTEHELLRRIEKALVHTDLVAGSAHFYFGNKESGVDFLAALCNLAGVVVAPSTGPLHVAVALGKPVVTFFPSIQTIRVQSQERWGPYNVKGAPASVLVPDGGRGMDALTVEQAFGEIRKILL